jgi:transposase
VNLKRFQHQEKKLEKRIAQYLAELDEADKTEVGEKIDRSAIKTTLAQLEVRHSNNLTCLNRSARKAGSTKRRSATAQAAR